MNHSQRENPAAAGRLDAHGDALRHLGVQQRLGAEIVAGRLRPGDRLAPERELCARYGVARNTLRRALVALAERGLLESRGRLGWYVHEAAITETASGPQGLSEWAAARGVEVVSVVLRSGARRATPAEAERLRIALGSSVFELWRVRIVGGAPLAIDRSVLHPRLVPHLEGVDFTTTSLWATLRAAAGVVPSRADVVVRAVQADAESARHLHVAVGAPLLELEETAHDQSGAPFEVSTMLNRGDRYAFATSLTSGAATAGEVT